MVLLTALQENYRKSFIRNNRVKKISSEPDAVIEEPYLARAGPVLSRFDRFF